jgi:hypothetical protein
MIASRFKKSILSGLVTAGAVGALTACGGGGGGASSGGSVSVPPPPPPPQSAEFTLNGVAAKGLLDGARVIVVDGGKALPLELSGFDVLAEGTTSADGSFSIEVQDSEGAANLLIFALMNDANMKCDSAIGCGLNPANGAEINFGESFSLGENDALLSAYISTPASGTTSINLNSLSTLVFSRMIGLAVEGGSVIGTGEDVQPILRFQDRQSAQDYVARVFDITSQDYTALNFIDLTEALPVNVSQAELRASLLSAGFLAAAVSFGTDLENSGFDFTFDDLFSEITGSFIAPAALIVREGSPDPFSISLEEMISGAALALIANVEALGGTANNAQDLAAEYLIARLNEIRATPANFSLENDGSLPQPPAEISFAAEQISYTVGARNVLAEITNPDGLFPLNSSEPPPEGAITFFADVTLVTPAGSISLNLFDSSPTALDFSFGSNLTAGTYETEVTFTLSEFGQSYTDTITVEVLPSGIGIAQDSVSMTTSPNSTARVDYVNPNDVIIATATIRNPDGMRLFEVASLDDTGFVIGYDSRATPAAGTYNVDVTIGGGLGAEANDVTVPLEIVVTTE